MSTPTSMVSLLLPEEMKTVIELNAQENQRSRSGEIRYALEQYYRMISAPYATEPVTAKAKK